MTLTMRGALTTIAAVLLGLWAAAYYGLNGAAAFCFVVLTLLLIFATWLLLGILAGQPDEERDL